MSTSRDLESFLSKHRIFPGDEYSHTSMKGGSWYIPYDNTAEFYDLYYDHVKNGGAAHITEKHKFISPILIDLDFRYANTDAKRVYTAEQMKEFTAAYMKALSECVDLSHDPTIFVLEKSSPKIDKDPAIVKDGIHMMIPGVITTPALQFLVRDRVLESGVISDVFKDCHFTNSAADIFDEQVIQKNNWLMHGSSKPNGIPYQVSQTYTYDVSDLTLNVAESKLTGVELIKELSIRNKNDKTPIKAEKVEEIAAIESDALEVERAKNAAIMETEDAKDNDATETSQPLAYSKIDIGQLLDHLDNKYSDEYAYWYRIGAALVNSGFSFEVFDTFSKKSQKYNFKDVSKQWSDFERKPMTRIKFASILRYLKQSDAEYFEVVKKQLNTVEHTDEMKQLKSGVLNHSAVAKIFYDEFHWKYQYSNGHWY